MNHIFTIYRSSAGSGKTRTLAKEYLKLALNHRSDYFKHILAVTFTNKATQEMKDRIIQYLSDFSSGRTNELAEELRSELNLDNLTFRNHCQDTLTVLLHHYDHFSISTIDAFFQRVIRSFTRESGLTGDYRLEVDQDIVLEEVVDSLIDELGSKRELTEWVVEFAKDNLENERAWDVRYNLIEFSREIFREEFKAIEEEVVNTTGVPGFFRAFRNELWALKSAFHVKVSKPAMEALDIIKSHGWDLADFSYGKNSGIISFFEAFAYGRGLSKLDLSKSSGRMRTYFTVPENWPSSKTLHKADIIRMARERLIPIIVELIETYDKEFRKVLSADAALRNMYVFGLIADITRKLKEYKNENNLMLLADAPRFLHGVIEDSDTPFIYEKVGSFYRNYLIDEFQDTSGMQWKNFLPLLTNSLDQGYSSLVVGDVKQAIYRWRGGDLRLLQQHVEAHIGEDRVTVKELTTNFRSASTVINFNNALFSVAASAVSSSTGHPISADAYRDVRQNISRKEEGAVQVRFLKGSDGEESWKEQALDQIPVYLEKLQRASVSLKDIAILVRKNEEGQQIVSHLLSYKNSEKADPSCRYDVVSNESLRLDGAASVNLLLAAMRYLRNTDDVIARAQLGFEFARLHEPFRVLTEVFAVSNHAFFESNLPRTFSKEKASLKKLPIIELTETLIEIFKLNECTGELAYLQAFQDLVLEFYSRERNDLGAFLEWWEANKHKKSIQISGDIDAVQLLTVHKSKGLQFGYVIIPFCSWGLDHDVWQSPNLWVKVDEPPFNKAGYLPVKYTSTLENTYFDEFYKEERTRTYLDNLNLLYVALTRAERGMIVLAPHPQSKGAKRTVAQLLFDSIQGSLELAPNWNNATDEWAAGQWEAMGRSQKEQATAVTLQNYRSSPWREKLVIRRSFSGNFADTPVSDKNEKISYGIHLHAILSRIKFAPEISQTLDKIVFEGLITDSEKVLLRQQLDSLLSNPQIAGWFSSGWDVRTEVPILMPGGRESRIDRLMIRDKMSVVVDFKTGTPNKDDQRQVAEYMDILRQMNFVEVEGYLLYVRTGQVVSVVSGKAREVKKKKNKDQLELGF